MQFYRPIRPYFHKPVAILNVPLRDWKITLGATVFTAVLLFFTWRSFYGIPTWFVFSLGMGFGLVSFFLWAHNSHRRGWLEYMIAHLWRKVAGVGDNLIPDKAGRKKTKWLLDAEQPNTARPKWLERA